MGRTGTQRRLALAPEDWFWATWRKPPPLPAPPPRPFDPEAAADMLEKHATAGVRSVGSEEGLYWLHAMRLQAENDRAGLKALLARLRAGRPADRPPADLTELLTALDYYRPRAWVPMRAVYPASTIATAFIRSEAALRNRWATYSHAGPSLRAFRTHLLPYLSAAEAEEVRAAIAPYLQAHGNSTGPPAEPPAEFLLAAALGMHAPVRGYVEAIAGDPPQLALDMVFGLGSGDEVQEQARRLKLRLTDAQYARAWLAHTEFSGLDWLGDSVIAARRSADASDLARVLALGHAPEVAPVMLEVLQRSRAGLVAQKWFETNPEHTAAGLAELCTQRGRVTEATLQVLRGLHAGRHREAVDAALAEAGPVGERLREVLTGTRVETAPAFDPAVVPEELRSFFEGPSAKLPGFLAGQELPALLIDGRRLTEEQLGVLAAALRESALERPHPLVEWLEPLSPSDAWDQLALSVLELWLRAGMPRKEAWALTAVGLLGGDACALRLGPLAIEWRKKLIHQAAKDAVACLRAIATDTALLQLRNITQVPRDWSLKQTASEHLQAAAAARGLTLAELEERMVPHCGLDARGSRALDFGPRRFTFVLGQGGKPMLCDGAGKLRPDLPKPNFQDDPALAEAAGAAWKVLKKQLDQVLKAQTARLERSMVEGHRWSVRDFQELIVRHPVMTLLARLLVWSAHGPEDGMTATFRVCEDQTLADADDAAFELRVEAVQAVGIPHPLLLSPELRSAWGERLTDYELTPPFEQLGRPIHAVAPNEARQVEITRFNDIPCHAMGLVSGLERRGWQRGGVEDGGCFGLHFRDFGCGLTAVVGYSPGIPIDAPTQAQPQELQAAWFLPTASTHEQTWRRFHGTERAPLATVDPIAFSEVVRDLAALTAHAP